MPAIRFPEGTTFRQEYVLKDTKRQIINLSGAQLTLAVFNQGDPKTGVVAPVFQKTVGDGITITDYSGGKIVIQFDPVDTRDRAGTYDWEMQLVEVNGDTWEAGSGALVVQPARRLDG